MGFLAAGSTYSVSLMLFIYSPSTLGTLCSSYWHIVEQDQQWALILVHLHKPRYELLSTNYKLGHLAKEVQFRHNDTNIIFKINQNGFRFTFPAVEGKKDNTSHFSMSTTKQWLNKARSHSKFLGRLWNFLFWNYSLSLAHTGLPPLTPHTHAPTCTHTHTHAHTFKKVISHGKFEQRRAEGNQIFFSSAA